MATRVYKHVKELSGLIASFKHAVDARGKSSRAGLCGFDGFMDRFTRLVDPGTMAEFGSRVGAAAGIAASFLSEHRGEKFGGNGPLITSALSDIYSNEIDLAYIGAMGAHEVLPVYRDALEAKTEALYTLAEPAYSNCLEFEDGKLMLCDLSSCSEITWERLIERVGADALDALLSKAEFIAAVNWGKLPHVGGIWRQLARRLRELDISAKQVKFFMDLAEFEHRSDADRTELIDVVAEVTQQCDTVLSFNLREAWLMAETLGGSYTGRKEAESVADCANFLKTRIETDRLIIHPNDGAACASASGTVYLPGPYCDKPLISTGAGDNFGAGCLAAWLEGLDDAGILMAGNCASGYFVRSGRSISFAGMCALLDSWSANTLADRL